MFRDLAKFSGIEVPSFFAERCAEPALRARISVARGPASGACRIAEPHAPEHKEATP